MKRSLGASTTHRVCEFDAALASDVSSLGKFDFEEGFPHIDDGPFFSTRAGNASYQVAWYSSDAFQRGEGYISLLPGGMMNIRGDSDDSRNVTSFAILADIVSRANPSFLSPLCSPPPRLSRRFRRLSLKPAKSEKQGPLFSYYSIKLPMYVIT